MTAGKVISNEEWVQELIDSDTNQKLINDFKKDKRGDATVRVIVTTEEALARYLYISFRDSGDCYRKVDSEASRKLAEGAFDVLMDQIENSDTPRLPGVRYP